MHSRRMASTHADVWVRCTSQANVSQKWPSQMTDGSMACGSSGSMARAHRSIEDLKTSAGKVTQALCGRRSSVENSWRLPTEILDFALLAF